MSAAASASFETPRGEADFTSLASSSCSSSAPPKAADGTPRKDGDIEKTEGPKVATREINLPDLSKCHVCGKKFSIFKRRQTCHNCHEAVCKACARCRKMLRAYNKPKRVCDLCIKKYWSRKNFDGETTKSDNCALSLTLPAADDTDSCREITSATSPNISAATVGAGSSIGIGDVGIASARTLPPPTPLGGDDLGPTQPASAVVRGQAGLGGFFGGRQKSSTSPENKKFSERDEAVSSSKPGVFPVASSVVEKEEASPSSPSLPSTIHKEGFTAVSTASSTSPAVTYEDGKVVDDAMGTTETKVNLPSPREGMGPDVATASSISVPTDSNERGESRDDRLRLDANEASTTDTSLAVTNAMASVGKNGLGNPQVLHIDHDEVDGDSMPTPVDKVIIDTATTSCSSAAIPDLAVKDSDAPQADNVEFVERTTETEVILPSPREGMGPDVATASLISVPTDTKRGEPRDNGLRLDDNEASSTDASLSVAVPIAINEGDVDLSHALQNKHDDDVDDVLLPASSESSLLPVLADEADATGAKCASAASPTPTLECSDILRQCDKVDDASLAEETGVLSPARENGVGQDSVALSPSSAETGDESGRAVHLAENSEERTVGGFELPGQDGDGNAASDIRETEKGGAFMMARHGKDNTRVVWICLCLVAVCMGLAVVFLVSRGRK